MSDNNKYDTMPFPFDTPSPLPIQSEGLKVGLRDYLAGQALAGLIACPNTSGDEEAFSVYAYKFADAMLAEREKERA